MKENYEKYRVANTGRILISAFDVGLLTIMGVYDQVLYGTGWIHLFFSLFWMFLIETDLFKERKYSWSGYIPAFMDISSATIIILMTGNIHSYLNVGYFIITAVSSLQEKKSFGLSIAFLCFFQYALSGLLVYFGFISNINIFADGITNVTITSFLIAIVWMCIGLFIVNSIIHSFVVKNRELIKKAESEKEKSERLLFTIQKELKLAQRIQKKLLPSNQYIYKSLQIYSTYIPVGEVGGDIFDIFPLESHKLRIFLADATGHGVEAALITMLIKSEMEGLKTKFSSPSDLLSRINEIFYNKYNSLSFFFSCVVVDIDLQKRTLVYSSAGHPNQYILNSHSLIPLSKTGKLIGVLNNQSYSQIQQDYPKSSKLLLFTDGLFEEFNATREEYGESRISNLLRANLNKNINEIMEIIHKDLILFLDSSSFQDDITIMGIEET